MADRLLCIGGAFDGAWHPVDNRERFCLPVYEPLVNLQESHHNVGPRVEAYRKERIVHQDWTIELLVHTDMTTHEALIRLLEGYHQRELTSYA